MAYGRTLSYSRSRMCLFLVFISFPLLISDTLVSGPQCHGTPRAQSLLRMGNRHTARCIPAGSGGDVTEEWQMCSTKTEVTVGTGVKAPIWMGCVVSLCSFQPDRHTETTDSSLTKSSYILSTYSHTRLFSMLFSIYTIPTIIY